MLLLLFSFVCAPFLSSNSLFELCLTCRAVLVVVIVLACFERELAYLVERRQRCLIFTVLTEDVDDLFCKMHACVGAVLALLPVCKIAHEGIEGFTFVVCLNNGVAGFSLILLFLYIGGVASHGHKEDEDTYDQEQKQDEETLINANMRRDDSEDDGSRDEYA